MATHGGPKEACQRIHARSADKAGHLTHLEVNVEFFASTPINLQEDLMRAWSYLDDTKPARVNPVYNFAIDNQPVRAQVVTQDFRDSLYLNRR